MLERAIAGTETDSFELPLQTQGKEMVTLLLNASSKKDNTGTITGVVGVGQDISRLNQAMAEVTRVADDLERLIDTANAPIFGVDTEGKVTEWNNKAVEISGFSKEETMGQSLVQHVAPTPQIE